MQGDDASHDLVAVDKLRRAVEHAKIGLSTHDAVDIKVVDFYLGKGINRRMTRGEAETIWADLFERAIWPVDQVIGI